MNDGRLRFSVPGRRPTPGSMLRAGKVEQAGEHPHRGPIVPGVIAGDRVQDADVIDHPPRCGKEVADRHAALATGAELQFGRFRNRGTPFLPLPVVDG